MSFLVRAASLTDFAEVARSVDLDPLALLDEVGLPRHALSDPDLKISGEAVRSLLELAAERSGVETFGLRMAEKRRASNLGLLALLVREEPTLRRAFDALSRFGRFQNEALVLKIEDAGNFVILREELIAGKGAPVRQGTELAVAVLFKLLRTLLGPAWRPREVCFTHPAPRDRSIHARVFGSGVVRFGQDFNGFICDAKDLHAPNPGADPVLGKYARQILKEALSSESDSLLQAVRQLIVALLPSGKCSAVMVAQHLGVDRRTVHRHLTREGCTFNSILDEVRRELAERYLAEGARTMSNVSALLGFAAPSVFSRWYARRFKVTPSSQRADRAPNRRRHV